MLIRTFADIGAIIRDRRKTLKLDQSTLAKSIGASRQWVIALEHGHARAELDLVLRAIDAVGIRLDASIAQTKRPSSTQPAVDINAILTRAKMSKQ
jgi:HTH-type transcriptional regulator / antitoxin HipB